METGEKNYLSKTEVLMLKGFAVIFMFIHHFLTFPEMHADVIDYPYINNHVQYLREPFRICVSIFVFVTGYTYFYVQNKCLKYSIKKICILLVDYWLVYFIFELISIGWKFSEFDFHIFLKGCLGLDQSIMTFCWYVFFYVFMMLIFPYLSALLDNDHFSAGITGIMLPVILCTVFRIYLTGDEMGNWIWNFLLFIPVMCIGYIYAKYNIFFKVYDSFMDRLGNIFFKDIILCIMIVVAVWGRYFCPNLTVGYINDEAMMKLNMDILYAPMFIYACVNLARQFKNNRIHVISELGKQSMLMWFGSCIFFNSSKPLFQPILYLPKNPVLVVIWGTFLCYIFALLISFITKPINDLIKKILS